MTEEWKPPGCPFAEHQAYGYTHIHGRDCEDDRGRAWVGKTSWRERLLLNTWRRPFPYLLKRWEVQMRYHYPDGRSSIGWAGFASVSRKMSQRWADEYNEASG